MRIILIIKEWSSLWEPLQHFHQNIYLNGIQPLSWSQEIVVTSSRWLELLYGLWNWEAFKSLVRSQWCPLILQWHMRVTYNRCTTYLPTWGNIITQDNFFKSTLSLTRIVLRFSTGDMFMVIFLRGCRLMHQRSWGNIFWWRHTVIVITQERILLVGPSMGLSWCLICLLFIVFQ